MNAQIVTEAIEQSKNSAIYAFIPYHNVVMYLSKNETFSINKVEQSVMLIQGWTIGYHVMLIQHTNHEVAISEQ